MSGTNVYLPADSRCPSFPLRPITFQSMWQYPYHISTPPALSCNRRYPMTTSFSGHPLINDVLRLTRCDPLPLLLAWTGNIDGHVTSAEVRNSCGEGSEDLDELKTNLTTPLSFRDGNNECHWKRESSTLDSCNNEYVKFESEPQPTVSTSEALRAASSAVGTTSYDNVLSSGMHNIYSQIMYKSFNIALGP